MELQPRRDVRVTGEDYLPVYRVVLIEENEEHPRSWPREVFFVHGGDVQDVASFAQERAGSERLVAIALETPIGDENTSPMFYRLSWVCGLDPKMLGQFEDQALLRMRARAAAAGELAR
jgi:hypothetical protein